MLSRSLLVALAVGGCWLLPAPARAQKDPQATFEPRSKPGAGQKFLTQFVGEWDVEKAFHPRNGEPARSKGSCRQEMIQEGRFLKSDFAFEAGGTKTTGMGLIGYEPEPGRFTSVWVDSRSTKTSLRYSRDPFDGKEIVLHSGALGEEKATRRSRTVTRLEDNGNRIVHRQYTAGADGEERLVMELVLTRKSKATPAP